MNEDTSNIDENTIPEQPEKKPDDFGQVIDVLHTKRKLSTLRTYQGDVAEYIKDKNESVVSVVVKEKEREQQREADPLLKREKKPTEHNTLANLKMVGISLVLLCIGGSALWYIFSYLKDQPSTPLSGQTGEVTLVPHNATKDIVLQKNTNLKTELAQLPQDRISTLVLKDATGAVVPDSTTVFSTLQLTVGNKLSRTLKPEYMIGTFSKGSTRSNFIVLTVNDFGQAFSGMLEWEATLPVDLSFVAQSFASTTDATFAWKDVIVKNKDTRSLIDSKERTRMVYTFLDKNTILITDSLQSVAELSSIYASQSFTR